jgi:hypothetical protein
LQVNLWDFKGNDFENKKSEYNYVEKAHYNIHTFIQLEIITNSITIIVEPHQIIKQYIAKLHTNK